MRPRVLVTSAEERSALAACRGLGLAGYDVGAAASRMLAGTHWSRYCRARFRLPNPVEDPQGYTARLEEILASHEFDVLLPTCDPSVRAILGARERIEPLVRLGFPSSAAVTRCLSKVALVQAAISAGLPPPASTICELPTEAKQAADEIGFPLLVKPAQSVVLLEGVLAHMSATLVSERDDLAAALAASGFPCLLQRFETAARIFSCAGVIADGNLLAFAFSGYERTWRTPVGSAAFSRTLAPSEGLEEQVHALVAELGWQGIFEIELLKVVNGRLMTIDFNPRIYGSMALAIRAGANLPALWCDWLMGKEPVPLRARPGFHYRFEEADARHFIWQIRRYRLREAWAVLRPHRRTIHAFFQLSDPGPFVAEFLWIASRAGRKAGLTLLSLLRRRRPIARVL